MSAESLEKRAKALEDEYFHKKNQEALARLVETLELRKVLPSPVTGKDMKHALFKGVNVFVCPDSKGFWVEKNELLELIKNEESSHPDHTHVKWDEAFFEEVKKHANEEKARGAVKVAYETEGQRLSPASRQPMGKVDVGGVLLDICPTTGGVWFDQDELKNFLEKAVHEENGVSTWVNLFYKTIGYK